MKVIVLGASHGGIEVVEALRLMCPNASVQWYDKGDFTSTSAKDLESIQQQGVSIFSNTEITKVEPGKHQVEIFNRLTGETQKEDYDKIILSPGAKPFIPPVPGQHLKNIGTMSSRQDLFNMRKHAADPDIKNVVIVGAGYIGTGAASLFAESGKKVTLMDINDRPLSSYLDQEFTEVLEKEMKDRDVELALGYSIIEFVGDENDRIVEVVTKKGTYSADLVILSAGNRPNTEWLQGAVELLPDGRIKTDEYMRTSDPDVFAIGDATTVWYNPGKMRMNVSLGTNARRQAHYAVKNLFEAVHPLPGVQGSSGAHIFDYYFATVGLNDKTAKKLGIEIKSVYLDQETALFSPETTVMFKLVYDPATLEILGGQIMSKVDLTANINTVSLAIQTGCTLEQLAYADFFFQPELNTPWNVINTAGLKALLQENLM
ncbi:FAD-dependent oxidoreductase [Paenibacillus lautus]|jgi:NADH peroxidase|uniref:FAD-dependent oxidoreductase n=1 Tax=Paenibacillus lautus TaxID=1401 RepID=A0A385TNP3_PAELA|nr:FAD-dependent oxidoreductase [Paenibacillus lautus]AYB42775.1 FAD-dependent oxidoreductase [Paenibacillus lautus]MBY0160634.1 FAD-dependent oxidoreductase [Cytobacillus firmus]MCI1776927.1 FAD-dependent oxidoreductase [Paenibacillus lautus]VTR41226.1 dihydrolipoamide dehydrogenase [Actinobacillus pleuropneumoniae]